MFPAPTIRADEPSDLRGEPLLANADGEARVDERGVIVFVCYGWDLDIALRLLGTFAVVLDVIVTAIVLVSAAPKALSSISVSWVVIAIVAWRAAFKRRRRHGRFELDFEANELRQRWRAKLVRRWPIGSVSRVVVLREEGDDDRDRRGARIEDAPARWLELHLVDGERLRVGRGRTWELSPIIAALRAHGVEVA